MRSFILIAFVAISLMGCDNNKTTSKENSTKKDTAVTSKDTTASAPATATAPMDSAAMMKAWNDYMTPGPMQSMMAKYNGVFNQEVTLWMAPGAPAQKSTSKAVNKMILGGRYQESHSTGNFNGMPFEGINTLAYDNIRKVFQSSWVDNMGSGIMYMEGTWDSTAHVINFKGKVTDPMKGQNMDIREVFTLVNDDEQKMEMFATQGGKEYKSMEIIFRRAK